jgi:hypothetical protein
MRMYSLAGQVLFIALFALPVAAQAPSPTREMMGRAEIEAQKRSGIDLLRRTENSGRYDAVAPETGQAAAPPIEGLQTRSAHQTPKEPESRTAK